MNKNKSRDLIAKAFLNQVSLMPLSKITIKSVVEATSLSRRSFYNNFNGIYDVIVYVEESIDDDIYNKIEEIDVTSIDDPVKKLIEVVPELIYAKRDQEKIMYSPNLRGVWGAYLEDKYTDLTMKTVFKNYTSTEIPKKVACHYFIQSFLYIVGIWITQPVPEKPEKFKKIFETLMKTSMIELPEL
ncbi:hypothetical protein ACQW5G_03085 [Fructilactobacillus sp. Tb1]|uniref:hypothetical protein n=1 Tax=Fructilactobacillus sp. Tb1 TaxID=3422304 RepID=UPI003D272231